MNVGQTESKKVSISFREGGETFLVPPHVARWLSDQLWLFAAEVDGNHDTRSRRLKNLALFG